MYRHTMHLGRLVLWIGLSLALLAGCGTPTASTSGAGGVHSSAKAAAEHAHSEGAGTDHTHGSELTLPHIHGLGFTRDGRQLVVPAHVGLFVLSDGRWQRGDGPEHDYMGFSASDDGFYSSGHPAPSATRLANPLGLVKSTDGGRTLSPLGFQGESDFHLMSVGYHSHALYVLNPAQNSKLAPGLHRSLDDGKTWQQSALGGVSAAPWAMAVHPSEPNTVALATERGVLLSSDHGDRFAPVGGDAPATAVAFSPDGARFVFGSTELFQYTFATKQLTSVKTPELVEDERISYVAINPAQPQAMALATTALNMFHTTNGGQTWQQVAANGVVANVAESK